MRQIDRSIFKEYADHFRPMAALNRFAYSLCGGPCAGLFVIENGDMLKDLAKICIDASLPFKVLGGISNVLISDSGFDGIVLLNRSGNISHQTDGNGQILLTAESGVGMANLVNYCTANEISGLEWAAGLPGTVGGAVYGNAGAFGSAVADSFVGGKYLDQNGSVKNLQKSELNFGYRASAFKQKRLSGTLIEAIFALQPGDTDSIRSKCEENREKRKASQPVNLPSLGSVFKNPEGTAAGKLIEEAGLKGKRIGKAEVSAQHANFITTEKGVTGEDYYRLVKLVQETVLQKSGILLETEIEFLGFERES